ncbi:MAG: TRAP transporter small permease [Pararhodobacter sp.]|nr:TRAP transporter small permease [Pararhodobacter sp.]
MLRLQQLQDGLLAALAVLGAVATLLLMVHVGADIVMRNIWNAPIPATWEIVTHYYMVALAFIPLAWVEKSGAMVQVEVINGLLSPGVMRLSDLIVAVIGAVIYGVLAWVTYQAAMRSMSSGQYVMANQMVVVVWPAYWIPPLGFGLASLVVTLRGLHLMIGARA